MEYQVFCTQKFGHCPRRIMIIFLFQLDVWCLRLLDDLLNYNSPQTFITKSLIRHRYFILNHEKMWKELWTLSCKCRIIFPSATYFVFAFTRGIWNVTCRHLPFSKSPSFLYHCHLHFPIRIVHEWWASHKAWKMATGRSILVCKMWMLDVFMAHERKLKYMGMLVFLYRTLQMPY